MYVLDGTSQDGHTDDKLTVLSDAGLVPYAIVVGIPSRGNRGTGTDLHSEYGHEVQG